MKSSVVIQQWLSFICNLVAIHLMQCTIYSISTPIVMTKPLPWCSLWLCHNILGAFQSPKAGTVVYKVPELLAQIINCCSWASRVTLSNTTIRARIIVQASIHWQILIILKPFVKDLSTFFILIHEIKAAVISSAAWNVLTINNVGPQDLNIVVPNRSAYSINRLKALLSPSGTTVMFNGPPGLVYENHASHFVKLMQKSVSLATPGHIALFIVDHLGHQFFKPQVEIRCRVL